LREQLLVTPDRVVEEFVALPHLARELVAREADKPLEAWDPDERIVRKR
jgi:hypothetical protein